MEQINTVLLKESCKDYADLILDELEINVNERGDYLTGSCPIHVGDNPTSFSYLKNTGTWVCWTKGCHKRCGNDIIGLAKAIWKVGFQQTQERLVKLIDFKESPELLERVENNRYVSSRRCSIVQAKIKENKFDEKILMRLQDGEPVYSYLYEKRGFYHDVINEFEVAYCANPGAPFYNRIVFPVRSKEGYLVGFTGRWRDKVGDPKLKWMHLGSINDYLYGLDKAKDYINDSQTIILCEGPLGVLKLWQCGIKNAVCIFGVNLSARQKRLILESGAFKVIICLDNDKAGREGALKIKKELSNYFYVDMADLGDASDVDEMKDEEVKNVFRLQLDTAQNGTLLY